MPAGEGVPSNGTQSARVTAAATADIIHTTAGPRPVTRTGAAAGAVAVIAAITSLSRRARPLRR
jgi:hypothetical protein